MKFATFRLVIMIAVSKEKNEMKFGLHKILYVVINGGREKES